MQQNQSCCDKCKERVQKQRWFVVAYGLICIASAVIAVLLKRQTTCNEPGAFWQLLAQRRHILCCYCDLPIKSRL
jgi:hypothetical protein